MVLIEWFVVLVEWFVVVCGSLSSGLSSGLW